MTEEMILKAIENDLSPYRLGKILSSLAKREVAPQGIYAAVRSGKIPSSLNSTGKKVVARKDAVAYALAFLTKNEEKTEAKADEVVSK